MENKPDDGTKTIGFGLLLMLAGMVLTAAMSDSGGTTLFWGLLLVGAVTILNGVAQGIRARRAVREAAALDPWNRPELSGDQRLVLHTVVLASLAGDAPSREDAVHVSRVIAELFGFAPGSAAVLQAREDINAAPHDTLSELRALAPRSGPELRRAVSKAVRAAAPDGSRNRQAVLHRIAQVEAQLNLSKADQAAVISDVGAWRAAHGSA